MLSLAGLILVGGVAIISREVIVHWGPMVLRGWRFEGVCKHCLVHLLLIYGIAALVIALVALLVTGGGTYQWPVVVQTLLRLKSLKCLLWGSGRPLKPLLTPECLLLVGEYYQLLLLLESMLDLLRFGLLTSLDLVHNFLNKVDLLVLLESAHPLNNILGSPLDTSGTTLLLYRVLDPLVGLFRLGWGGELASQGNGPLSLVSVVQDLPLMLFNFFLDLRDLLIYNRKGMLLDSLWELHSHF
jgi:hypothetical protein